MTELFHLLHQTASPKAAAALDGIAAALLDVLLTDGTAANRINAARLLLQLPGRVTAAQLLPALDDDHSKVRLHVIKVLRRTPDDTVIAALIDHLNDVDPLVRAEVLATLVEHDVSSVTALPNLLTMLNDSNPMIRTNAAQALGRTGSPEALPALTRHLHDPDSRVSLAAVNALGQLGDRRAADPLFDIARAENTYYRVRDAAVAALAAIAPPDLNDRLFKLLQTPDLPLRQTVIDVLPVLSTEQQVEQLLDIADWHTSLVRPVRHALVRSGGVNVERVMIDVLGHVREWVRALAVEVLGEIRSREAVPHILPNLREDSQEVRLLAANALGNIGDARAVPALIDTLQDPVWLIQVAASSALARIDSDDARAATVEWQREQRNRPSSLDLDTDEHPPDVDLSDIL